jgi:hypothetical protein
MSPRRKATLAVAGLRIAYGAALALAPARTTRAWLGSGGAAPGGAVAVRALGAREVVLHGGAVAAALSGDPVAPWLVGSIAGDASDIAATFAGGNGLPDGAPVKTLAVAGASAALTAVVLTALDD